MSRLVCCTAGLRFSWKRNRETLTDFGASFVPDENRDESTEVFHVECVRRGVSPLVMVTMVIGGCCRGSSRDDGAVGAVRVRGRARDVFQ